MQFKLIDGGKTMPRMYLPLRMSKGDTDLKNIGIISDSDELAFHIGTEEDFKNSIGINNINHVKIKLTDFFQQSRELFVYK